MIATSLVFLALHGASFAAHQGEPPSNGSVEIGGFSAQWSDRGVSLAVAHKSNWQTNERLMYRPDYVPRAKAFVLVTDASEGKFHVSVVDRSFRVLAQLEISGATAGMPSVVPCGDSLTFADPGILARAPIAGENNSSWVDLRKQVTILSYSIASGTLRWQKPELTVGQPLAASGAFLWTVKLTNPDAAYSGSKALYELQQVGCYTGKVVRTWAYPASGVDLTAYRWRADARGTTCVLHRLEPWPDETIVGNTSPAELALARILGGPKAKKRAFRKKAVAAAPKA